MNLFSSLISSLFGSTSSSGVTVSFTSAQQHTVVMDCWNILSETLASMPIHLMRRTFKDGEWHTEKVYDHPLYDILNLQPNNEMTQYTWIESMMMNVVSRGNAFSQIVRNNRGDIIGFYPLLTDNMRIVRSENGRLGYIYSSNEHGEVWLEPYEIYKITYKTFDGIVGMSPIEYSANAIGMSMALEEFGGNFFKNGTNGGAVFELESPISETAFDRLKGTIKDSWSGLTNSGKPMLLDGGLKYKQVQVKNNESQFLESRKFQKAEIASIYRVPLHLLNEMDAATFSNITQQSTEFATNTMTPWVNRFEQPLNIIIKTIDPTLFATFNMDALLRGDLATRYESYGKAITNGFLSINEVRKKENLNPKEGMDELLIPLNMTQGGNDAKTDESPN